jgi:hypothetical protein
MNQSITISEQVQCIFTAHATLAAIGVKVRQLRLLKPIFHSGESE